MHLSYWSLLLQLKAWTMWQKTSVLALDLSLIKLLCLMWIWYPIGKFVFIYCINHKLTRIKLLISNWILYCVDSYFFIDILKVVLLVICISFAHIKINYNVLLWIFLIKIFKDRKILKYIMNSILTYMYFM